MLRGFCQWSNIWALTDISRHFLCLMHLYIQKHRTRDWLSSIWGINHHDIWIRGLSSFWLIPTLHIQTNSEHKLCTQSQNIYLPSFSLSLSFVSLFSLSSPLGSKWKLSNSSRIWSSMSVGLSLYFTAASIASLHLKVNQIWLFLLGHHRHTIKSRSGKQIFFEKNSHENIEFLARSEHEILIESTINYQKSDLVFHDFCVQDLIYWAIQLASP